MNKNIKFNVLDFTIILFSALILLSVIFWNNIRSELFYEEKKAEYTFIATGLTEEMILSISENDKLFFDNSEKSSGTLKSYQYEKEILPITLIDGTVKYYEAETYALSGTVSAEGVKKENGFYINGDYFIVAGKKFNANTSKISFNIEISNLNIKWITY